MPCVNEVCGCDGLSALEGTVNIRSNAHADAGQFQLTGIKHHFLWLVLHRLNCCLLFKGVEYDGIQIHFHSP